MKSKSEKLLYSKRDDADALSLSVRSIDYLIITQRLPMRRVGGKVMIPGERSAAIRTRGSPQTDTQFSNLNADSRR